VTGRDQNRNKKIHRKLEEGNEGVGWGGKRGNSGSEKGDLSRGEKGKSLRGGGAVSLMRDPGDEKKRIEHWVELKEKEEGIGGKKASGAFLGHQQSCLGCPT